MGSAANVEAFEERKITAAMINGCFNTAGSLSFERRGPDAMPASALNWVLVRVEENSYGIF